MDISDISKAGLESELGFYVHLVSVTLELVQILALPWLVTLVAAFNII